MRELAYELKIRGVTTLTSMDVMRKTFRRLRQLEGFDSFTWPTYPYTFAEYETALKALLADLKAIVTTFSGDVPLAHALGRLNRNMPADETHRSSRSEMLVSVVSVPAELG